MDSSYSKLTGVVLRSFSESDFSLLNKHKKTMRIQLWLEGISMPDLDFLSDCPSDCPFVEEVDIYGGKIDDYSALSKLPNLKNLFLNGRLRKWVENLDFINDIHSLKSLGIHNFPMLTHFPCLGDCRLLESVRISTCKRLTDISNVASINSLKNFGIVQTPVAVEDLDFIARKFGMEKMSGSFGSKKKNDLFQAMLDKYGLIYG